MRIAIQELTKEKDAIEERYDIEVMTVEALQEYLKSLEKDHQNIIQESEKQIQRLKKEKHELQVKWFKSQKSMD